MTASTLALLLAAQVYPVGHPGGPADPWGKCKSLTSFKARQVSDHMDPTQDKVTRDIETSVMTIDETEVSVSSTFGTLKSLSTYSRSAPGWFRVSNDRVIDQKTSEKQEVTIDGKKFSCALTEVRFQPGGVSKAVDTLKTWTSPSVRGGMVKFELVRHASNLENSLSTTYTGEVTKLDDPLTIGGKKVDCAVFTTKDVNAFGVETLYQAWHSDAVPGKIARILSERRIKDRIVKVDWILTEFQEPIVDLKLKKK